MIYKKIGINRKKATLSKELTLIKWLNLSGVVGGWLCLLLPIL